MKCRLPLIAAIYFYLISMLIIISGMSEHYTGYEGGVQDKVLEVQCCFQTWGCCGLDDSPPILIVTATRV